MDAGFGSAGEWVGGELSNNDRRNGHYKRGCGVEIYYAWYPIINHSA